MKTGVNHHDPLEKSRQKIRGRLQPSRRLFSDERKGKVNQVHSWGLVEGVEGTRAAGDPSPTLSCLGVTPIQRQIGKALCK